VHQTAPMRGGERIGNLRGVLHRVGNRECATSQPGRQRFALDKLHHQIVDAFLLTDVEQRGDVWMVQR